MNYKKICMSEAIALILIVMINQVFLGSAKQIIISTHSSAWLNTLFVILIGLGFIFIITKLYKKFPSLDIIDVSNYIGGKILKAVISIISIVFFVLSAGLILYYISDCLEVIYLSNVNILFIYTIFLIGASIAAYKGINAIFRTNLIVVYITIIPIMALWVISIFKGHIEYIFPILGNGLNETFFSNTTNIYAFSGLIYLFFIMPFLNNSNEFSKISFISFILSSVYLFFSVISLLLSFPFADVTEDLLSIHLLSRTISIGSFLQRVDALYMFLWTVSAFSYLSFLIFFICNTFKKITNIKNSNGMIYIVMFVILGIALSIPNIAVFRILQLYVFKYYSIILFVLFIIILFIGYMKKKKNPNSNNSINVEKG